MFPQSLEWSFSEFVNDGLEAFIVNYGDWFETIANGVLYTLYHLELGIKLIPWWLIILLTGLLAWHATRRIVLSCGCMLALFCVGVMGLWSAAIQTVALMTIATSLSIMIGIPVGVLISRSDRLRSIVMPILDAMQTLPSFVYLIPALMLFGLGKVPAIFATVIYAIPPLIRLTDLGIKLVDKEVVEAAHSFGASSWQMLFKVELPLAKPNIMAGINQTTMMALSMVVIASMIGARGLGENVLLGIQHLDVGSGLEAGIAIVILAIIFDRISQAYGKPKYI